MTNLNNGCHVVRVGFGKVDVTPFAPVHLGSYNDGMERISNEIRDNFYALTLAITDMNDETLIFIVTDLSWGYVVQTAQVREAISKLYGISKDHVMLGGTHNHNGPDWYDEASKTQANKDYLAFWLEGVLKSVDMAMKNRKCASFQIGRTRTENMSFVRRYWRADGNLAGGGPQWFYKESDSPIVAHETEADEEVQMVKIIREGEKDILIVNWQNHGCHTGHLKIACTDWIGPMRKKVEQDLNCHCFYMQGAAGNLDTRSRIKGECPKRTTEEYGEEVAGFVVKACQDVKMFRDIKTDIIKTKQEQFTAIGKVAGGKWTGELNALSIGELSVVTFPVEMFDTSGKQIKSQTPDAMTLLMGYANGIHGYCPDQEAYMNGGYEAHSRAEGNGTAEKIVSIYLDILNQFHKKEGEHDEQEK